MNELLSRAKRWSEADCHEGDRRALSELISRVESGDEDARADLADRFCGPLEFGTAGLRGVVGAGETRMNEAVVVRATHGLVRHLIEVVPDARARGLVIGRDARLRSDELAEAAAEVATALGMKVFFIDQPAPTPVTAFGVIHLRAAGGIVVTASHNPPEYNGYKVFFENGAQIIPPHDQQIAALIEAAPDARSIERVARPTSDFDSTALERAYIAAVARLIGPPRASVRVAYTPLHGVGARFVERTFEAAGFSELEIEPTQRAPDGNFPTVKFPNPEEPGAMSRVIALAERINADLVIANDPDADRLAIAVPDAAGGFVALDGNEIGILLAHHVLARAPDGGPDRLVVTTVVSSQQLRQIAAGFGVRYAETLTGFKWIANQGLAEEASAGARFVFGYEEALGYTVNTVARDKDGVGAALVFAELAATCKADGLSVLDRLREIRERFGLYVSKQKSVVLPGRSGAEQIAGVMKGLRADPPSEIGGIDVLRFWDLAAQTERHSSGEVRDREDLPPANALIIHLSGGGRIAVRPSGTEPKVKLYIEVVETITKERSLEAAERAGRSRIDSLLEATLARVGLG